jgi:hypothetical protein
MSLAPLTPFSTPLGMTKGRMNIWRELACERYPSRRNNSDHRKNIQRCLDFARCDKRIVERGGDDLSQPDECLARVGAKQ